MTTKLCETAGKRLCMNAVTVRDGAVSVELLDEELQPLPGYGRDDVRVFHGDDQRAIVSWGCKDTIDAKAAHVRFYLKRARLYGCQLV